MDETINLQNVYKILRKRLKLILLFTVIAVAITAIVSYFLITPTYETSSQILINQEQQEAAGVSNQSIEADLQLINTYSVIIKSPVILDQVIEQLGLPMTSAELDENIRVENAESSQVVNIFVRDENPGVAVSIANRLVEVFEVEIQQLMNVNNVNVLSPATNDVNPVPVAPNPLLNILIAAFAALVIGIGLAFLAEYLDTTMKDDQDIKDLLDIPVLGVISPIIPKDEVPVLTTAAFKRKELNSHAKKEEKA